MKTGPLFFADVRFQFKYGFYFLYTILCLFYAALFFILPEAWREKAAVVMVFSDPAAMGLFFMGAIVLFEKSERVLESLAVSPARPFEYAAAKLLSLAAVSSAAGLAIGISGGIRTGFYFIAGVFLGSCLFSSVGLMLAANISTLNGFIISTIPAGILINLPALSYLFGWEKGFLILHPGVCMIELCLSGPRSPAALFILALWTAAAYALSCRVTGKMLRALGGVRL